MQLHAALVIPYLALQVCRTLRAQGTHMYCGSQALKMDNPLTAVRTRYQTLTFIIRVPIRCKPEPCSSLSLGLFEAVKTVVRQAVVYALRRLHFTCSFFGTRESQRYAVHCSKLAVSRLAVVTAGLLRYSPGKFHTTVEPCIARCGSVKPNA
jgi:hypothetical protein